MRNVSVLFFRVHSKRTYWKIHWRHLMRLPNRQHACGRHGREGLLIFLFPQLQNFLLRSWCHLPTLETVTKFSIVVYSALFDFNLISTTDLVLQSVRDHTNTHRLAENWRPITEGIFKQFPNTQFVVYHKHDHAKIDLPKNVEVRVS